MKKNLGKYKGNNIIDLNRKCLMCSKELLVTDRTGYVNRENRKFCTKKCAFKYRYVAKITKQRNFFLKPKKKDQDGRDIIYY